MISVIMSVYNGQEYIEQSIQSILDQDYKDFEFIIVDDGSSDQTWSIVQAYQEQDNRVRSFRLEKNAGTSQALTTALNISRGNYIARQDADDISLPERLTKQMAFLEAHAEVGLLGSYVLMIDAEGKPIKTAYEIQENDQIQKALLDYMCICGPSVLIRRADFEKAGYYFTDDMSFTEDYDLCLRLGEVSSLRNYSEVLYYYRQHSQSVSHSKRFRQMRNKAIALERAIYRRNAPQKPPPYQLIKVSRDYIRASVLAYCDGLIKEAHQSITRSTELFPDILEDLILVEEIVKKSTPQNSSKAAINFIEGVFTTLFPSDRQFIKLKRRLIARIYIKEVFAAIESNDRQLIDENLWRGIQNHPKWLLNRGIFKTVLKQLASKLFLGKGSRYG